MNQGKHQAAPHGPVLALDLGEKLVGAAVSDEHCITIKRLEPLTRSNWKRLLSDVKTLIESFDAQMLVIGLPLRLDGSIGTAAEEVSRLAQNFSKSLNVPVFLQDERLTSFEARQTLLENGFKENDLPGLIDGESAVLILRDFLNSPEPRQIVDTPD